MAGVAHGRAGILGATQVEIDIVVIIFVLLTM
jgi:hypothetical protein